MRAWVLLSVLALGCGKVTSASQDGASGGADSPAVSCMVLQAEYQTALADAKKCNNAMGALPCQVRVPDKLACACETFVDRKDDLEVIRSRWNDAGCKQEVCPAIACRAVTRALCVTQGASLAGVCQDQL